MRHVVVRTPGRWRNTTWRTWAKCSAFDASVRAVGVYAKRPISVRESKAQFEVDIAIGEKGKEIIQAMVATPINSHTNFTIPFGILPVNTRIAFRIRGSRKITICVYLAFNHQEK